MKTLFTFAFIALLLASCGNTKKLKVSQIRSLQLEYSPGTDLNFGSTFEGAIKAILNSGEERDITNYRKLEFISTGVRKSGRNFTVTKHPTNFTEDYVVIGLSVSDKEETFGARDTIRMNFQGGLTIDGSGAWGSDAEDQKDRGSRIILRDGKIGDDGLNGESGFNGGSYEAHLWKEGNMYYLYVRDLNSLNVWKYRTLATSAVLFNISGGRGGDGGKGGGGGDGKNGKKDEDGKMKRPGDGGNAGHGGHGGNGGNGGNLQLVIHSNASAINPQLKYDLSGGPGGEAGKGGSGGDAGDALEGQAGGSNGANGRPGSVGGWGANGVSTVEYQDFDPAKFKQ